MKYLIIIFSIVALSSCSKVLVYDNSSEPVKEKGIKFYYHKPYLMVSFSTKKKDDGEIEEIVTTQIIYLPDLKNPKIAKLRPGFGSSNLSLGLSNGILTAVGQQSDSKIPETITSIGGVASSLLGAEEYEKKDSPVRLFEITEEGLREVNIPF